MNKRAVALHLPSLDLLTPTTHNTPLTMSRYEIVERDEAGSITKTYIASGEGRVDVIVRFAFIFAIERAYWVYSHCLRLGSDELNIQC